MVIAATATLSTAKNNSILYNGPFEETFPQCKEITAEQCHHTRLTQRVLRALLRLLAPLM